MRIHFNKIFIISIIILCFASSVCFASFIRQTDLEFYANQDNTIDVKMTIDYETLTTDDISFIIYGEISNAGGFDENGNLSCIVYEKTYGSQIICKREENIQNNYSVTFTYKMDNIIFEENKMNKTIDTFLFEYGIIEPTDELRILFVLPEGYGLLDTETIPDYYPPDAETLVIDGRKVALEWTETNLVIGNSYFFKATYEKMTKPSIINNGDPYPRSYKIIASVVVVGLLCFMIIVSFSKTKKYRKKEEVEEEVIEEEIDEEVKVEEEKKNIEDVMLISLLKEDEKKVFNIICASGGIGKQRQIARATRFSPAKTSHIVKGLSARGLIDVRREGRTTRIELTKKAEEFLKKK